MEGCLARSGALLVALLVPALARADRVNNEWLSTTRALSMGNVGIASAEDSSTAAFYNPAALARTKRTTVEYFNPQFEVGTGTFAISGGAGMLGKNSELQKVAPLLQSHPGKATYLGASLFPNVHTQNFNFGILARGDGGSYYDANSNKIVYRARRILAPSLGLSAAALGGRFRLGVSVRALQLTENDRSLAPGSAGLGYTVDAEEGFGVALDAGALLSLPWGGQPTFGIVARNVGGTSLSTKAALPQASGTVRRHSLIRQTYDAGFSLSSRSGRAESRFGQSVGGRNSFTFASDFRDVLNENSTVTMRRVNVGFEFGVRQMFFVRAGVSRGYWTAGVGLSAKYGTLDLGTYGEELSSSSFRLTEDRRISFRYGSRF